MTKVLLKNSHTERQSDSGDYNRNIKYIKTLIGYLPYKKTLFSSMAKFSGQRQ